MKIYIVSPNGVPPTVYSDRLARRSNSGYRDTMQNMNEFCRTDFQPWRSLTAPYRYHNNTMMFSPQFAHSWQQEPRGVTPFVPYSTNKYQYVVTPYQNCKSIQPKWPSASSVAVLQSSPQYNKNIQPLRAARSESDLRTLFGNFFIAKQARLEHITASYWRAKQKQLFARSVDSNLLCWMATANGGASKPVALQQNEKMLFDARVTRPTRFDVLRAMWIDAATVTIQRFWRGFRGRRKAENERRFRAWRLYVSTHACRIQSAVRRYLQKLRDEEAEICAQVCLERKRSAITLQRHWRAYKQNLEEEQMKIVNAILRVRAAAAIEIQRVYRGYRARKIIKCEKTHWVIKWLWDPPGRVVEVVGSFTSPPWSKRILMSWNHDLKQYVVALPQIPGRHELKFVVNGSFCCDGALTVVPDGSGHFNNVVVIPRTTSQQESHREPIISHETATEQEFAKVDCRMTDQITNERSTTAQEASEDHSAFPEFLTFKQQDTIAHPAVETVQASPIQFDSSEEQATISHDDLIKEHLTFAEHGIDGRKTTISHNGFSVDHSYAAEQGTNLGQSSIAEHDISGGQSTIAEHDTDGGQSTAAEYDVSGGQSTIAEHDISGEESSIAEIETSREESTIAKHDTGTESSTIAEHIISEIQSTVAGHNVNRNLSIIAEQNTTEENTMIAVQNIRKRHTPVVVRHVAGIQSTDAEHIFNETSNTIVAHDASEEPCSSAKHGHIDDVYGSITKESTSIVPSATKNQKHQGKNETAPSTSLVLLSSTSASSSSSPSLILSLNGLPNQNDSDK